ncbi:hypothetical protein F4818DRAFT_442783 [Hypoxylon cercidicola]|nr:hypothetical protein F4818DRAFT_442783 [Hypoxylon cercidicola]
MPSAEAGPEPLPAFTPDGLEIVNMRSSSGSLDKRANCQNSPGVANGECVTYYSDGSCKNAKKSYKPTCAGNCYVDDFYSVAVAVAGDGTYGTDCELFLDNQCQQKVLDTGNVVTGGAQCSHYSGKSMRCYYRC